MPTNKCQQRQVCGWSQRLHVGTQARNRCGQMCLQRGGCAQVCRCCAWPYTSSCPCLGVFCQFFQKSSHQCIAESIFVGEAFPKPSWALHKLFLREQREVKVVILVKHSSLGGVQHSCLSAWRKISMCVHVCACVCVCVSISMQQTNPSPGF